MRIDLYTKTILTIIAICLITLSVRSLQEPSHALAQTTSRVIIEGFDNQNPQFQRGIPVYIYASNPQQPIAVDLARLAGGAERTLPVTLVGVGANTDVPVRLTGAGTDGKGTVPVNVLQVAGKPIEPRGIPVINPK